MIEQLYTMEEKILQKAVIKQICNG